MSRIQKLENMLTLLRIELGKLDNHSRLLTQLKKDTVKEILAVRRQLHQAEIFPE
jgi:hypothetical protein